MPTRDRAPLGAPCWVDLQTSDVDRARAFYTSLFGWTAGEPSPEFGGYFMFTTYGAAAAGCMTSDPAAPVTDVWSVYLATDNAAKTLDAVTSHGGQVIVPAMPVADLGTMGFVIDAGGAGIGLWQPDQFQGLTVLGESGTPSWFELMARDYDASLPFYREVFDWDTAVLSDTAEFRYSTLNDPAGEGWLAGVMDAATVLPEGVPPHWTVYFGVDDADDALAKIVEFGGAVVRPAADTEYGRIAAVTDPCGAHFTVVAPNEAMPAR